MGQHPDLLHQRVNVRDVEVLPRRRAELAARWLAFHLAAGNPLEERQIGIVPSGDRPMAQIVTPASRSWSASPPGVQIPSIPGGGRSIHARASGEPLVGRVRLRLGQLFRDRSAGVRRVRWKAPSLNQSSAWQRDWGVDAPLSCAPTC